MTKDTFHLILVRHGQTDANKLRIIQGHSNYQLNELGIQQAEKLADHFRRTNTKFDYIFSSDLDRASMTARLLVGSSREIILDKRLRERCFGVEEGTVATGKVIKNFADHKPEGGETMQEVNDRVIDFCNTRLLQTVTPNSSVLVVTHGGVICEFMRFFKHSLHCNFSGEHPLCVTPNTGVNVFNITYNQSKLISASLISIHQTIHLQEGLDNNTAVDVKEATL